MTQEPGIIWKGLDMDYLTERVRKLVKESSGIKWDREQGELVSRMIETLEDIALVADDLVDAVAELDTRLIEIEEKTDGEGPE